MSYKDWMEQREAEKHQVDQRKKEVKEVIAALTSDAGDSAAELEEIKQMAKDAQKNGAPNGFPQKASTVEENEPVPDEQEWGSNGICSSCGRAIDMKSVRCQYCGAKNNIKKN